MSSYASKFQKKKNAPASPVSSAPTHVTLSPANIPQRHAVPASPASATSQPTTMQHIRMQTLRRRQRFQKMQEEEKMREVKRRENALRERKQRLRELDPMAASPASSQPSAHRKRPSRFQPSQLIESLDLQSSVHDSTQMFRLAEKLAKERNVSASRAVHILQRNERPQQNGVAPSRNTQKATASTPPTDPKLQERISARQRLIGQKFKLQPIEVASAADTSSKASKQRVPANTRRAASNGRGVRTPSSVMTPGTPNTIRTTFTAHTDPLGRPSIYPPGDTSSVMSSNYDFDDNSILSAPSRINYDPSRKKKTRSRPWREKPVIPQRKDFETGYSIEISNVENSIANLDKLLDQKKEVIKKAARERVLWLKSEEERKRKKREELANKENMVHNRIPHEDYGKYLSDGEDEDDGNDLVEDDVADETEQPAAPLSRKAAQPVYHAPITQAKPPVANHQAPPAQESAPPMDTSAPSSTRTRRVSFSRGTPVPTGTPAGISNTPQQQTSNLIRRVPSIGKQSSTPIHNSILPRVPSMNTLQQLPNGTGRGADTHVEVMQQPSPRSTIAAPQPLNLTQTIQEDIAPLASTIRTTHRPVGTLLKRSPKSGGLQLRSRRFVLNKPAAPVSQLPAPSRVVDYQVVPPANGRRNQPQPSPSNVKTRSQPSFLENSVVIDDDIPEMPFMKRHSFGRQPDMTENITALGKRRVVRKEQNGDGDAMEGGVGQINVADSHALEFLGLK